MRIFLELNNIEAEKVFEIMKTFTVDKLSTGVMEQTKPKAEPKDDKPGQLKEVHFITKSEPAEEKVEKAFEMKPTDPKPETKEVTLEEVRAVLADKPKPKVKVLLQSFGAAKLTDVDPSNYAAMLEKAGEL